MSGRSPNRVVLSEAERAELEHVAACYTRPRLEVQRAKLVLLAAGEMTNAEIGARLGMSREAVGRWRRRFCEQRLEGLRDKPRAGRPCRFPPGRGRAGQSGRVRAAQDARRAVVALSAGLSCTASSSSGPSATRRRQRSAGGWPRTRSSRGSTSRGSFPRDPDFLQNAGAGARPLRRPLGGQAA